MSTDSSERSPYTRPIFVVAATVIGLIVVAGIVLSVIFITKGLSKDNAAADSPAPAPVTEPTTKAPADSEESRCGLNEVKLEGTLLEAPAAEWAFVGGSAQFPASASAGPAETLSSGAQVCFEHTPTGAVFAAAAITAQLSESGSRAAIIDTSVVEGPLQDAFLEVADIEGSTDIRMTIAGFKLMAYTGDTARVDVGIIGKAEGQSVYLSSMTQLRWVDGDWKLDGDIADYSAPAVLPDLAGFKLWSE